MSIDEQVLNAFQVEHKEQLILVLERVEQSNEKRMMGAI
jgi:hypothetical protein